VEAEGQRWLSLRLWYRAIGFGLGLAALALTFYIIMFGPFVVGETNPLIKWTELVVLGLGFVALLTQLVAREKRTRKH
jgi:hypothetical protein